MKLLFDENLSERLAKLLETEFPGSTHVRAVGLSSTEDSRVWEHARAHGLTIVSKDDDFHQRSFLLGHPPKVIWVRLGNCTTDAVAALMRNRRSEILAFDADASASFLALS